MSNFQTFCAGMVLGYVGLLAVALVGSAPELQPSAYVMTMLLTGAVVVVGGTVSERVKDRFK